MPVRAKMPSQNARLHGWDADDFLDLVQEGDVLEQNRRSGGATCFGCGRCCG